MNESKERLLFIYDNTKMGVNNKIKFLLEEELQKYESLHKECNKLMKKEKIENSHSTVLKDLTANTAMSIEVSKDNSDAKIASILSRGFNMGNINIEAKIKDYKKEVDKSVLHLAENLLKFGEEQIELLKEYL